MRKKRTALPQKTVDALCAEYYSWRTRAAATQTDPLDDACRTALDSGTLSHSRYMRIRDTVFIDLLGAGTSRAEVCRRLCLREAIYLRLLNKLFDTRNPANLRAEFLSRNRDRWEFVRAQRVKIGSKKGTLTKADLDMCIKLVKLEQDIEDSGSKLLGVEAPQQIEVTQHKTYSVSLEIHGTREQLADVLEGEVIESTPMPMVALPPPDPLPVTLPAPDPVADAAIIDDEPPFPSMDPEE